MESLSSGYSSLESENGFINKLNTRVLPKSATTYELEKFKKKLLLIFNHKNFDNPKVLARDGTEKDVEALTRTFERVGFDVVVYNDLTEKEIFETLDASKERDFSDYGCVAIAILTHGAKGILRARDRRYNEVEVLKYLKVHDNPTLVTKPRILIAQACRGINNIPGVHIQPERNVAQDGEDDEDSYYLPAEADILLIHSCYWDTTAFRELEGSWFIQSLCKNVDELAATHDLEFILTKVKREVAYEKEYTEFDINTVSLQTKKQMPTVTTTLTRLLYLKKYGEFAPFTSNIPLQLLCKHFFSNVNYINDTMEYLRLKHWISATESYLQLEEPGEEGIIRIDTELQEYGRIVNSIGPRIRQILVQEITADIDGLQARFFGIANNVHMQRIRKLRESLDKAKDKFARMGPVGSDISAVKRQLDQLVSFKQDELQSLGDKIEAFNRQSQEHTEITQVAVTVQNLIKTKTTLLTCIMERQRLLENTLLSLQKQKRMLQNLQSRIRNSTSKLVGLTSETTIPEMLKLKLAKLDVLMEDTVLSVEGSIGNNSGTSEVGDVVEELATLKKLWSELQKKVKKRIEYEFRRDQRRAAQREQPTSPDSFFQKIIKSIKKLFLKVWRFLNGFKKVMKWISVLEEKLQSQLNQSLPQSIEQLESLIKDHEEVMDDMQKQQKKINKLCKRDDELWVKSRDLWRLARGRKRHLLMHFYYLKKLNGDSNFCWYEWRKQFLKFIINKNFELTDLFREADQDFSVVVLKQKFIDSIRDSGFESSREDLNKVVKLFFEDDMILLEEFVSALIPDWIHQPQTTRTERDHINTVPNQPEARVQSSPITIPRNVNTRLRNVAFVM